MKLDKVETKLDMNKYLVEQGLMNPKFIDHDHFIVLGDKVRLWLVGDKTFEGIITDVSYDNGEIFLATKKSIVLISRAFIEAYEVLDYYPEIGERVKLLAQNQVNERQKHQKDISQKGFS